MQNQICHANVINGSVLAITLTSEKAIALEGTTGFGITANSDTIDVVAGFSIDLAGNVSSTDAVSDATIGGVFNQPTLPDAYSFNFISDTLVLNENTGEVELSNSIAFDSSDSLFIAGTSASGVVVGGSSVAGEIGNTTLFANGKL